MSVKIRILCSFLGIIGGLVWLVMYFMSIMELVVFQEVSGLPLHLMFKTTLVFWGLFFIGALIGKRKIFVIVSLVTIVACITTACFFIIAAEQLSTSMGNFTSAVLGEPAQKYQVSYFKETQSFLPSIICGVLGLLAALKFGKKHVTKKEI